MYADDYETIPALTAGNIAVLTGLKVTKTGDTLLAFKDERPIQLFPMNIPPPVFIRSIEAESLSEEKKLSHVLTLLQREDPSLHVENDPETGQVLIGGLGELHLEIVSEKLTEQYKVKCNLGPVSISYREKVTDYPKEKRWVMFEKEIFGKLLKMSLEIEMKSVTEVEDFIVSLKNIENSVTVKLKPENTFVGSESLADLCLSQLPRGFPTLNTVIDSIHSGVQLALNRGPVSKFPLINTGVAVTGLKLYQPETSSAGAIRMATYQICQTLLQSSKVEQLEPVMLIKIKTFDKFVGAVTKDITGNRQGHVLALESDSFDASNLDERKEIISHIPLSQALRYSSHLRSITGGNAEIVAELCGYMPVSR
jgi:elongation factor G